MSVKVNAQQPIFANSPQNQMAAFIQNLFAIYSSQTFPGPTYGLMPTGNMPLDPKVRAKMVAQSPMLSSWVKELGWDELTQTIAARLGNKWYYWQGDGLINVYLTWSRGLAICKTDDPTGQSRWYMGKSPSLGAAYHQMKYYLAGRNI
jgi:hypothetical protein